MSCVNTEQVEALRTLLASSGWLDRTKYFARALRGRSRTPNGLLVVGTPTFEPWHMAAHLDDESRYAGLPELAPTLVRWAPPTGAPAHLRVGIDRIARAGRSETLLVVGSDAAPDALLERVADARKAGASILALDRGDDELDSLAHEYLAVRPVVDPVSFDGAQHLVSMAVGEADLERMPSPAGLRQTDARESDARQSSSGGVRGRLARLLSAVSGTPDS
ncbi:MAG TPA: hypothetical protein VHJ18_25585 [Streptosporangiaceae bacterium]|jgi:hypothetical protein|nr:hypothetical protein [Streptosporangiaceae bacterium]